MLTDFQNKSTCMPIRICSGFLIFSWFLWEKQKQIFLRFKKKINLEFSKETEIFSCRCEVGRLAKVKGQRSPDEVAAPSEQIIKHVKSSLSFVQVFVSRPPHGPPQTAQSSPSFRGPRGPPPVAPLRPRTQTVGRRRRSSATRPPCGPVWRGVRPERNSARMIVFSARSVGAKERWV